MALNSMISDDALGAISNRTPFRYEDTYGDRVDWFDYRGIGIRYYHHGDRLDGPAILICNGIGQNIEVMAPLIEALHAFEVVVYDIPGTGASDPTILPWSFCQHARLAIALMDHLEIEHFMPLGVSWGGLLAQQIAASNTLRVKRLILAGSPAGAFPFPASRPSDYSDFASMSALEQSEQREQRALADQLTRFHPPNPIGYFYQVLSLFGHLGVFRMNRLNQHALILQGQDDHLVPGTNARVMKRLIPNASLEYIDGGHTFMLTNPEQTAGAVRSFCEA